MKFGDLKNKLNNGISINEIINSDLNLIGNSDETDSLEDVKANGTMDNFVAATTQKGGLFRTNAIDNTNYASTVIEEGEYEDQDIYYDEIRRQYPIVFKNLNILIDSMHRNDINEEARLLIRKIINNS